MAFVNFATREITAKIVYYGPGLGGKTTSLQFIHNGIAPENRGKMISLATEEDRTIYFDFLPLNLGKIQDFSVRVQLYTVPGQVRYNATRKLVLRGADGLVFVADSQKHKKLANIESFSNMEENLREHGKELRDIPHSLQFNKIDLPGITPADELNRLLNKYNVPFFETCATSGIGILEALKTITKLVFNDLGQKALLQKKSKAAAGVAATTPMSGSLAETPIAATAAATPQPVPGYYAEADYSSQLTGSVTETPVETTTYEELQIEEPTVEDRNISVLEPDDEKQPEIPAAPEEIQEVEPIEDYEDLARGASGDASNMLEDDAVMPFDSNGSYFSYRELFQDPGVFTNLLERLEKQISANEYAAVARTAKTIYSHLMTSLYPREYAREENEFLQILALGIKFKRYLRFKTLVDSERMEPGDLLFIHHFLCDLYLSLKEF